ncbi:MAG: hypothetical protein M1830_007059 [Pleopsidium flavum]|nr:MAG: hypothetical protein M1830_007059 [Pleopsidium flavum]
MAPSRAAETTSSKPASRHVADAALEPFLTARFDPIDHLNATLPSLTLSSTQPHPLRQPSSISLSEASTQVQTLLSQFNAQTSRLSENLTQLTDEILRSGGRLAYEVEVLRSESTGLTEALTDWLRDDISKFVPDGLTLVLKYSSNGQNGEAWSRRLSSPLMVEKAPKGHTDHSEELEDGIDPPYIIQLRTLTLVRSRLESVINTFGEAMEWTLCPSDSTIASSFISVSAPEPAVDSHGREQKGKEVAKKLRDEISKALVSNGDGEAGLIAATKRVEELRDLATVWKGTAEEKARIKFVEGLARMIEDRAKTLERDAWEKRHRDGPERTASSRKPAVSPSKSGRPSGEYERNGKSVGEGGPGFLRNLQRLRDEIYLD